MNVKLNAIDRRQILELVSERERYVKKARSLSYAKIAEKFDVHPQTVKAVVRQGRASG